MGNKNTQTLVAAAIAAASAWLIGAPPALAEDTVTISRLVHVQDLDLSVAAGQATLQHRLHYAASRVCLDGDGTGALNGSAYLDCRKAAFEDAWSRAQVLIASATSRSLLAARTAPAFGQPERLAGK